MADDIRSRRLPPPERSVLFAAFTGEEKGLLGSKWYVEHPTIPISQLIADVNLDQLLRILTAEALEDTTLGDSFIFGYDPGTGSEQRYREWYRVRYHRPQDDLTQPVDFAAAARFNDFFYKLVTAISGAPQRPRILPTSQFAQ